PSDGQVLKLPVGATAGYSLLEAKAIDSDLHDNGRSGTLYVIKSVTRLGEGQPEQFPLTIQARDHGNPSSLSSTVRVWVRIVDSSEYPAASGGPDDAAGGSSGGRNAGKDSYTASHRMRATVFQSGEPDSRRSRSNFIGGVGGGVGEKVDDGEEAGRLAGKPQSATMMTKPGHSNYDYQVLRLQSRSETLQPHQPHQHTYYQIAHQANAGATAAATATLRRGEADDVELSNHRPESKAAVLPPPPPGSAAA
uniref:Cadherin domain-containing protein n=1 Tax=Macrostomum lignano TaxID=282301 RepID=A0A1I8FME3_9PLAT